MRFLGRSALIVAGLLSAGCAAPQGDPVPHDMTGPGCEQPNPFHATLYSGPVDWEFTSPFNNGSNGAGVYADVPLQGDAADLQTIDVLATWQTPPAGAPHLRILLTDDAHRRSEAFARVAGPSPLNLSYSPVDPPRGVLQVLVEHEGGQTAPYLTASVGDYEIQVTVTQAYRCTIPEEAPAGP